MPGVYHRSVDMLEREVDRVQALGIPALLLFGLPAAKDEVGSENFAEDGIVQRALRHLRQRHPDLLLITDVCCCEYTSHGHCGVLRDGGVDNDATLEILGRVAVSHAEAGADIVAPSGMMDGMVAAIRAALDAAGHCRPGHPQLRGQVCQRVLRAVPRGRRQRAGLRRPAAVPDGSGQRARRRCCEAALDEAEGADILMVKPALAYLDVVRAVRERTDLPLAAYNVSGEYSMVKAAARQGWIDERRVVLESADRHAAGGRRRDHHVPCPGGGAVAGGGGAGGDRNRVGARDHEPRSGCSPRRSSSCCPAG